MEVKGYTCDYEHCRKPIGSVRFIMPEITIDLLRKQVQQIVFLDKLQDFCSSSCVICYVKQQIEKANGETNNLEKGA